MYMIIIWYTQHLVKVPTTQLGSSEETLTSLARFSLYQETQDGSAYILLVY